MRLLKIEKSAQAGKGYDNTKVLVSYIDISVSGSSAFYFLNV